MRKKKKKRWNEMKMKRLKNNYMGLLPAEKEKKKRRIQWGKKRKKRWNEMKMKRFKNNYTGLLPAEKEKRSKPPTMQRTGSHLSWSSTTSWIKEELDLALAFEKAPNGPMRDRITVDILKIDGEDFKGTITPLEAKNLIYVGILSMDWKSASKVIWSSHIDWERLGRLCLWKRNRSRALHSRRKNPGSQDSKKAKCTWKPVGVWRRKSCWVVVKVWKTNNTPSRRRIQLWKWRQRWVQRRSRDWKLVCENDNQSGNSPVFANAWSKSGCLLLRN